MAEDQAQPVGPDLSLGISAAELPDGGKLIGHVGQEPVLLVRRGPDVFAIGAHCTHYSGPLADGLIVDGAVRCPWHHACFDLRTGEALRAPALSPVDAWSVEQRDGKIFVREKRGRPERRLRAKPDEPNRIVIVGGGAAGFAAAEMLRRQKYEGGIVMLSSDDTPPVDRPNLSKDYLAGGAPEEWLPLRDQSFYSDNGIDLRLNTTVAAIEVGARDVMLANGEKIPFDRLLLATGAEPVSPVHPRRQAVGCARASNAQRLPGDHRTNEDGAPDGRPGRELHRPRSCGLVARAQRRGPCRRAGRAADGENSGIRLQPLGASDSRAARRRLSFTQYRERRRGQARNAQQRNRPRGRSHCRRARRAPTAKPRRGGRSQNRPRGRRRCLSRNERPGNLRRRRHRALAGSPHRPGHSRRALGRGGTAGTDSGPQHAGAREPFDAVPFFWSQHYDVPINYVGHAESWDELIVEGDIANKDGLARMRRAGRTLAVASVFRDLESLEAEVSLEREAAGSPDKVAPD